MPKLTEGFSSGGVGRQAILQLIDEMNEARARIGIRERYRPVTNKGVVTMELRPLDPKLASHTPSPTFAGNFDPQA